MWNWFTKNKDVTILKSFNFKYKTRISGQHECVDTIEHEAIVKASSFEEAEKKLINTVLKEYKLQVIITYPICESR